MRAITLDNLSDTHLNVLGYGEPGVGKTRFGASVGEVHYTLIVDVDKGLKTLRLVPRDWLNNLVLCSMEGFQDLDKIYKLFLKNDPELWERELNKGKQPTDADYVKVLKPFEAVVFDTWSELNWEVKEAKRAALGKSGNGSLTWRENIQIQDWGNILDLHTLALTAFRDLPVTFVCLMHEQVIQDDKTKVIRGVPSLNGKLANELGKYFDVVGHMTVSPAGKYQFATKAGARYQAKTRLDIEPVITDPTFKGLLQAAKLL